MAFAEGPRDSIAHWIYKKSTLSQENYSTVKTTLNKPMSIELNKTSYVKKRKPPKTSRVVFNHVFENHWMNLIIETSEHDNVTIFQKIEINLNAIFIKY